MATKRYRSELRRAVHESARALFKVGGLTAKQMRSYDRLCLMPKYLNAKKRKKKPS